MSEYPQYLLKSFAKTTGLCVRMVTCGESAYFYASTQLNPDPAKLHMEEIHKSPHAAGVITTQLYQHYGYARLDAENMLIIGPTAALKEDPAEIALLVMRLGVPKEEEALYIKRLCCSPDISAQHLAWMLSFFVTAVSGAVFGVEDVHIATSAEAFHTAIAREHITESMETLENIDQYQLVLASYRFERVANQYVTNGQVEHLRELFESMPKIEAGKMAKDVLRQYKNMCICGATTFSRAAIEGGLDPQAAFQLSDLYIQKCELLREPEAISRLVMEMALDFAARVRALNYGEVLDSKFFYSCTTYIKQHLFYRIRVKDMADQFGLSQAYLSARFRAITGKTLNQFIQEQKIDEAKLLLSYADKSVAEIATHLAFSSQSHFQNVFKKLVSMTPLEYRRRCG